MACGLQSVVSPKFDRCRFVRRSRGRRRPDGVTEMVVFGQAAAEGAGTFDHVGLVQATAAGVLVGQHQFATRAKLVNDE